MVTRQNITKAEFKILWRMVRCNIKCGYKYYRFSHPNFTVDKGFVRLITSIAKGKGRASMRVLNHE